MIETGDEGLREQVRRAILDRDNPYLSEQISETQADIAADAVLPLLTAERERGMSEALNWAADWLESVGLGDEHAGYLRANARAALFRSRDEGYI